MQTCFLPSSLCTQNVQSNQLGQSGHVRRVARALNASAATIFLVAVSTHSDGGVRFSLFPVFILCVCVWSVYTFHNGFLCRLLQEPCQRRNVIRVEYFLRFCVDIWLL